MHKIEIHYCQLNHNSDPLLDIDFIDGTNTDGITGLLSKINKLISDSKFKVYLLMFDEAYDNCRISSSSDRIIADIRDEVLNYTEPDEYGIEDINIKPLKIFIQEYGSFIEASDVFNLFVGDYEKECKQIDFEINKLWN